MTDVDVDIQTLNEDWVKTGSWDLPTELTALIWAIGAVNKAPEDQAVALRNLMTLPAWVAVPDALRTQVESFVKDPTTPALGRNVSRWTDKRDWTEWDLEHPYVPKGTVDMSGSSHLSGDRMDAKGAAAVITALHNGDVATIQPSALPDVIAAAAALDKDMPINLHNLQLAGAGNENVFADCTMCLTRQQMPVIDDTKDAQNFCQTLAGQGISSSWESVDPRTLSATQSELDGIKVAGMTSAMEAHGGVLGSPPPPVLVVDQNGSILDGHHRWAAAAAYAVSNPGFTVPIVRVNTGIDHLVSLGNTYDASIPGHTVAKAFGQASAVLLNELRAIKAKTNWATPPADAPPLPDPSKKPYFWLDGKGWVLMATDTQDGIPRSLNVPPAAEHKDDK